MHERDTGATMLDAVLEVLTTELPGLVYNGLGVYHSGQGVGASVDVHYRGVTQTLGLTAAGMLRRRDDSQCPWSDVGMLAHEESLQALVRHLRELADVHEYMKHVVRNVWTKQEWSEEDRRGDRR